MHSSRMRTAHLLTVSHSILGWGWCPGGVQGVSRGVCVCVCPGVCVCVQQCVCVCPGCVCPRVCVYPSMQWGRPPPPLNRITVKYKKNPCPKLRLREVMNTDVFRLHSVQSNFWNLTLKLQC